MRQPSPPPNRAPRRPLGVTASGIGLVAAVCCGCAAAPPSGRAGPGGDPGETRTEGHEGSPLGPAAGDGLPQASLGSTEEAEQKKLGLGAPLIRTARLAPVAAHLDKGDLRAAAAALRGLDRSPEEVPLFRLLEATLLERAGDAKRAVALYREGAAGDGAVVAQVATWKLARALATEGDHEAAWRAVSELDRSVFDAGDLEWTFLETAARAAPWSTAEAWARASLVGRSNRIGWAKMALRIARVLELRPRAEGAALALEIARAIPMDSPKGRYRAEAEALIAELESRLPGPEQSRAKNPTAAERLDRAERLIASSQWKRGLATLDPLAKRKDLADSCALAQLRGAALLGVKRKSEAAKALRGAAKLCGAEPTRKLNVARLLIRAGALADGIAAFESFENEEPASDFRDDARVEAALADVKKGDRERAKERLAHLETLYPKGDRTRDGLYLRGTLAEDDGQADAAEEAARAGLAIDAAMGPERATDRAGRFRFLLARTIGKKGDRAGQAAELGRLLEESPLGFYAILALSDLGGLDPSAPRRAIEEALAKPARFALPTVTMDRASAAAIGAAKIAVALGDADLLSALDLERALPDRATRIFFLAEALDAAGDPIAAHRVLRIEREREPPKGETGVLALRSDWPRGTSRRAWDLAFPRPFAAETREASSREGVTEGLLYAVMREESAFDPGAVSGAGARGLLQIMPGTGARLAVGEKLADDALFSPTENTRLGARFLRGLLARFGGIEPLAFAGYNAGPLAPEAWMTDSPDEDAARFLESIPYPETNQYVRRVWSSHLAYEVLGAPPLGDEDLAAFRLPSGFGRGPKKPKR